MDKAIEQVLRDIHDASEKYKQSLVEHGDLLKEIKNKSDVLWSHWYEVPQKTLNYLIIKASGFENTLAADTKKTAFEWIHLIQQHLSDINNRLDLSFLSKDSEKAEKSFVELIIASQYNIAAIEQRNKSIAYMIEKVREEVDRSDDYILEVLTIDPAAISAPTVEKYIQVAAQNRDYRFLTRISKALMKESPRPRAPELDMLRLMMMVIAELQGKENPSLKAVEEANELLHLVRESEDTVEAIRHHIKTRRRDRRSS